MYVLVYEDRVPVPDGWMVVTRGDVRKGDQTWTPAANEWHLEDDPDDYFSGINENVQDFYCVIRRDAAGGEG